MHISEYVCKTLLKAPVINMGKPLKKYCSLALFHLQASMIIFIDGICNRYLTSQMNVLIMPYHCY